MKEIGWRSSQTYTGDPRRGTHIMRYVDLSGTTWEDCYMVEYPRTMICYPGGVGIAYVDIDDFAGVGVMSKGGAS